MTRKTPSTVAILLLASFLLASSMLAARAGAQIDSKSAEPGSKDTKVGSMSTKIGSKKGGTQTHWPSSTPEKQGLDSARLAKLLHYIEEQDQNIHSLLVIRDGHIVVEAYYPPYTQDTKHILNSCTKSFVSALIGIAIANGQLRGTNSALMDFFPEYRRADQDPRKARITIEHLLTMSSGIDWPQFGPNNILNEMHKSKDWVKFILDRPMAAEPGVQGNYSNGDSHLLSAIIQKATGETALDYGRKNLFEPLGITDLRWDSDPQKITIGSATMYLTPRDMAKLGLLYLNDGVWNGTRLVPADWVKASLQSHIKIPSGGTVIDYGYFWWIHPHLGLFEAWGGAGQRIGIFPKLRIVTVMTSDLATDNPVTTFSSEIYRHIIEAAKSQTPLPDNPEALAELRTLVTRAAQKQE